MMLNGTSPAARQLPSPAPGGLPASPRPSAAGPRGARAVRAARAAAQRCSIVKRPEQAATDAELEALILDTPQRGHPGSGSNGNNGGAAASTATGGLVLPPKYQQGRGGEGQAAAAEAAGALVEHATAADVAAAAAESHAPKKPLRVGWAGSGIYFWWQLGAMQYLASRFDLTRVPMAGASGGALCAVLGRCGVDPEAVTESAYQLSLEHKIWERPLGLVGVWGSIIEKWLDDLLPPDAAARCSGGLGIVVTRLPSCRQQLIDEFTDKADLINCCMASAHVPLLLDWRPSRALRGAQCVDGSFPDFFVKQNTPLLGAAGEAVVFDYFHDPNIVRNGRMDMLQLKQYAEIMRISQLGARYAQRLEEEGAFEPFHLEPVLRSPATAASA